MSIRNRLILAVVWLISLVAVGTAQAPFWVLPEPKVLFGDDVGFRVEGVRGKVPTGVIVIKVNGNWVEAQVGGRSRSGDPYSLVRFLRSNATATASIPSVRAASAPMKRLTNTIECRAFSHESSVASWVLSSRISSGHIRACRS